MNDVLTSFLLRICGVQNGTNRETTCIAAHPCTPQNSFAQTLVLRICVVNVGLS